MKQKEIGYRLLHERRNKRRIGAAAVEPGYRSQGDRWDDLRSSRDTIDYNGEHVTATSN